MVCNVIFEPRNGLQGDAHLCLKHTCTLSKHVPKKFIRQAQVLNKINPTIIQHMGKRTEHV